jgi:hypothetical protein
VRCSCPLTLVATTGLEDDDQGLASGLFNTSQQIGGALGLAILSTIAASHTADSSAEQLVNGFHWAFAGGAVFLLGALVGAPDDAAPERRRADRADGGGPSGDRRGMKLRADAQRNLDRLLEAAGECFAEHGVDASIDEIARGQGWGTARSFAASPRRKPCSPRSSPATCSS